MRKVLDSAVRDCVLAVGETFGSVFARIEEWRSILEAQIDVADGAVAARQVDDLVEALVLPSLSADGALVIGAGFVARPGFLVDAEWHLAWWLGHANTFGADSADPTVRRLEAEENPASESFRDYTTLEWWRVPVATAAAHITGPYVDYLCTDDYTLTLTVPTWHRGTLAGVVGADLYVNDIERILLPLVRSIDGPATLVNASGRVVVSTVASRPTGSLLRAPDDAEGIACASTSLRLVLA